MTSENFCSVCHRDNGHDKLCPRHEDRLIARCQRNPGMWCWHDDCYAVDPIPSSAEWRDTQRWLTYLEQTTGKKKLRERFTKRMNAWLQKWAGKPKNDPAKSGTKSLPRTRSSWSPSQEKSSSDVQSAPVYMTDSPSFSTLSNLALRWHLTKWPEATELEVAMKLCEESAEVGKIVNSGGTRGDIGQEMADVLGVLVVLWLRYHPELNLFAEWQKKLEILTDPNSGHRAAVSLSNQERPYVYKRGEQVRNSTTPFLGC